MEYLVWAGIKLDKNVMLFILTYCSRKIRNKNCKTTTHTVSVSADRKHTFYLPTYILR